MRGAPHCAFHCCAAVVQLTLHDDGVMSGKDFVKQQIASSARRAHAQLGFESHNEAVAAACQLIIVCTALGTDGGCVAFVWS
jgi:hypothetical protein